MRIFVRLRERPAARESHVSFGAAGERSAAKFLRRRGYKIVGHNFKAAGAEIDLIALDGDTLVFIEVKARRGLRAGSALEAVDSRKQARIRKAGEIYIDRRKMQDRPVRFDVITLSGATQQMELVKDAF